MAFLLQLPAPIGAFLAIIGTVAIGVVPFVVIRRVFAHQLPDATTALAGSVSFRVGALHGLILALVFADAQASYTQVRQAVAEEAAAVADLADNLERFDDRKAPRLRHALREYVASVVDEEWRLLDQAALSDRAWMIYDLLEMGVLDLAPDDLREQSLREQMLDDLDFIADRRQARLFHGRRTVPEIFWYVALVGFGLTATLFFVYHVTVLHVGILTVYGAYTGLVLYFILAMHHPFAGPAKIAPDPFLLLLDGEATVSRPR